MAPNINSTQLGIKMENKKDIRVVVSGEHGEILEEICAALGVKQKSIAVNLVLKMMGKEALARLNGVTSPAASSYVEPYKPLGFIDTPPAPIEAAKPVEVKPVETKQAMTNADLLKNMFNS